MKCFSTLEEKFRVSARPRNILVISQSSPVSFREIAETSRKVANLHGQSCPNFLGSQWRNRLTPKLRVSSDLTGHIAESVQIPGKPK